MTSKLGFSLFVKNPAGSICHNNLQYLSSSFKNKLVFKVKILVSDLVKKKKGVGDTNVLSKVQHTVSVSNSLRENYSH